MIDSLHDNVFDVLDATDVEFQVDSEGKVWVNVDGVCRVRIGKAANVTINDTREKKRMLTRIRFVAPHNVRKLEEIAADMTTEAYADVTHEDLGKALFSTKEYFSGFILPDALRLVVDFRPEEPKE